MPNYKISSWIQEKFKEYGKQISKENADFLFSLTGNNLRIIKSEIDKLVNYSSEREINLDSIKKLTSYTLNDDIFLFSEKIANKKRVEATKLLEEQLRSGFSPIYLLTMIVRQYRILLEIKSALDGQIKVNTLAQYLSLHPFVIKKSMNSVNLYSLNDLKLIYRKLLQLDKLTKTSKLKSETLLNLFLLGI